MRADRLVAILMLLQNRGKMSAWALAEELEVSERTIYRDITALSTAGVPVYTERGPGGGIALIERYRSDLTGLNRNEVRALFMLRAPAPVADLGLDQELKGALLKLSAALPATLRGDEAQVRQRILIDTETEAERAVPGPLLHTLQAAVWSERVVRIEYRSVMGPQVGPLSAVLHPYGLVYKTGSWYLVGQRERHPFVIRTDRIQMAAVESEAFTRPDDFDLTVFWREWWGAYQKRRPKFDVRARVSPALVPWLPQVLGAGRLAEEGESVDGWLEVKLVFETLEEARGRLLAFGGAIEVFAPEALRQSLADYGVQIQRVYQN